MNDILFFDLESDGLLRELTRIHCLSIRGPETELLHVGERVAEGLKYLMVHTANGGYICGHNVIAFDIPALQKVYPWFKVPQDKVIDTLVISRLLFADIGEEDHIKIERNKFPKNLRGSLSLEAWGHRLGDFKGDFKGPWATYTPEMGLYCTQDTKVTATLFNFLMKAEPTAQSLELEHKVQWIVQRQVRHGISFNETDARTLLVKLETRKEELVEQLKALFGPIYVFVEEFTPKANNARMGYTGGCPLSKIELQEFNPGSRDQIAARLKRMHGWEPREDQLTPTGKPKIDEDVLKELDYPCIPLLLEYLTVGKRISQLSDGASGWLKHVTPEGRIHGSVNTCGAVTGRMTHATPNLAQVPKVGSLFGHECRALFKASTGFKLVGCDADGLELRCLSHYLTPWDKGQYAKAVDEGKKEDGTDIHTLNQKAAGLPTRDNAKTFIYGWLYGAGDAKIGKIIGKGSAAGKKLKDSFLKKLPALASLKDAVAEAVMTKGYLKGLDGRRLKVRSEHSALNTLLQSAGALLMKQGLVVLDEKLQEMGLVPGTDYEFVLNVHDEWQIEVREGFWGDWKDLPTKVSEVAEWAIKESGAAFKFRCPLKGNADIGFTWADTH